MLSPMCIFVIFRRREAKTKFTIITIAKKNVLNNKIYFMA